MLVCIVEYRSLDFRTQIENVKLKCLIAFEALSEVLEH